MRFRCREHAPSRQVSITNWYERKVMEKVNTFLSKDAAFQTLTCLNLVTCQNEFAGISRSAVSEEARGWMHPVLDEVSRSHAHRFVNGDAERHQCGRLCTRTDIRSLS
jgi:hypothetical protein